MTQTCCGLNQRRQALSFPSGCNVETVWLRGALLCVVIALAFVGCGSDDDMMGQDEGGLTVMTYNVYFGGNAQAVLTAAPEEIPEKVADLYQEVVVDSDFRRRAPAIATLIGMHEPHFIGLQEVTKVRAQLPGDAVLGGTVPAEDVVVDFLDILIRVLEERGLGYMVAAEIENMDFELPMRIEGGFQDARLTLYDVLLVRSDVTVLRQEAMNYDAALPLPPTIPASAPRGYVDIDATVSGHTYRVVSTHLEALNEGVRLAQAMELIQRLQDGALPIVLLGDFNTRPDGSVYGELLRAGYHDAWQGGSDAGFTCCHLDLRDPTSTLNERIDYVFVRNTDPPSSTTVIITSDTSAFTIGDQPSDRLSDLWPSDHAGVVGQLPIQ